MKKFTVILIFLAAIIMHAADTSMRFFPGTPIMSKPDINSEVIGIIKEETVLPLTGKSELFFNPTHPTTNYFTYHEVILSEEKTGYVATNLRLLPGANGKLQWQNDGYYPLWRPLFILAIAAAMLLLGINYRKRLRSKDLPKNSWQEAGYFITGILLLRMMLLIITIMGPGNVICAASDDTGYFAVANDLLKWNFDVKWAYTIGLGVFFYIPFMLLTGADKFYDIAIPFAYFSGFILAPLTMAGAFALLKKIGFGNRAALAAILIWAIYPFFVHQGLDWNTNTFTSAVLSMPLTHSFQHYMTLLGSGFNAMSDTPANFMLVATLLAAASLKPKYRNVAIIAALFSITCLIRINSIFFAPAVGYLLFAVYKEKLSDWRFILSATAVGAGTFLLIFTPQFIANQYQFGSIFTFPYVLHYQDYLPIDQPSAGFTFHTLFRENARLTLFLGGTNFVVWAAGIAGLLSMHDSRKRNILALWAIPVILFFLGYSHTYCDPVRFILGSYIPLIAAFTGTEVWEKLTPKLRWILIGLLLATIILSVPFMIYQPWFSPFWLKLRAMQIFFMVFFPIASLAMAFFLYRKNMKTTATFLLIFAVLYSLANAYVLAILLLLILLRSIADVGIEVFRFFRNTKNS